MTLLVLLFQSTLLLALGLTALHLTRKRGPAVQTLIGRAALVSVALLALLLPLSGHIQPAVGVKLPEPTPQHVVTLSSAEHTLAERQGEEVQTPGGVLLAAPSAPVPPLLGARRTFLPPAPTPQIDQTREAASAPRLSISRKQTPAFRGDGAPPGGFLVPGGFVAVTSALLLWLAVCQGHLTRLRRVSRPIASGPALTLLASLTPNPPRLLTHPAVHSPFLAGLRRPAIFLPAAFETDFDTDALRAIFVHELAHLRRRDNLWTLAARFLVALLWFQPLLWLLVRRLEQISEDACDEAVLAASCPPRAYAACLLSLAARPPLRASQRTLTAGVAPFRSSVGRRISRILSVKGVPIMLPVTLRLRLSIAAFTLAAALGGAFLVSSAPAQQVVYASALQPVASSTKSPLIGMWLYHAQPIGGNKDDGIVVYRPDGRLEYVFSHQAPIFGTYIVRGDQLQEHLKTGAVPDPITQMRFGIVGNTLGIRDGAGEVSTAKRVPEANQAALMQRTIGDRASTASDTVVFASGNIRVQDTLNNQQHELQVSAAPSIPLGQAQFLAGLTPVQGPGVIVTLTNSEKRFSASTPAHMMPPNLIHDNDINQVVNELKSGGAEAISINGQRLVAISAVRTAGPTIFINNTPQVPPFVIQAIGDPKTLLSTLDAAGGIAAQIKAYDKAMFTVQQAATLTLPAYSGSSEPRYARPVGETAAARNAPVRQKMEFLQEVLAVEKDRLLARLTQATVLHTQLQAMQNRPYALHRQKVDAGIKRRLLADTRRKLEMQAQIDALQAQIAQQISAASHRVR